MSKRKPVMLKLFDRTDDLIDQLDITIHRDESPVRITVQMYEKNAGECVQTANFTAQQMLKLSTFLAEHDLGASSDSLSTGPLWEES